jgi:hypothetical protein
MSARQLVESGRQHIETDSRSHLPGSHVRFSSKLAHKILRRGSLAKRRVSYENTGYLRIGKASPTDKKVERRTKLWIVQRFAPETRLKELHSINCVLVEAKVKP